MLLRPDAWNCSAVDTRYMTLETIAPVASDPIVGLPMAD